MVALRSEIDKTTDQDQSLPQSSPYNLSDRSEPSQSCHVEVADQDDLPTSTRIVFLGPQSSFQLCRHFLTDAIGFHIPKSASIPGQLLLDVQLHFRELDSYSLPPSFPITSDLRKVELYALVPPSTQRAVIDYYIKVVAPQYTLFSLDEASPLFAHENALKWFSSNKTDPTAYTLIIVFAIAAALICRDLDSNLANIALQSREELQRLCTENVVHEAPETTRTCATYCALALCEMIDPITGQFWATLGRSLSVMQDLQQDYLLKHSDTGVHLQSLKCSLLKLERYARERIHD